jgi:hypothetical protein
VGLNLLQWISFSLPVMTPAEAFAAIALAAVACDGMVDAQEAAMLRVQLEGRHPFRERSEESMGVLFEGLLDQLQAEGWRTLISRAIPVLTASQRETALAMAAHLIHGDRRVNTEEIRLLGELAVQMGLADGRAEQILEVIAVLHNDSLDPRVDSLRDRPGRQT